MQQRLHVTCEALFRKSLPAPDLAYVKLESLKKIERWKKENILKGGNWEFLKTDEKYGATDPGSTKTDKV